MRVRIVVVVTVLAVFLTAAAAWAGNTFEGFQIVRVLLNNQEVVSDVPAINFHGRTLLPLRKMAELAGLTLDRWDPETNTAYLSGGGAQSVAVVNGQPITKDQLYDRMLESTGKQSLAQLIDEALINQAVTEAGVSVTAEEIEQEIAAIRSQLGGEANFKAALAANSISLEQLRSAQGLQLKLRKLLSKQITVTDEALRQFFAANQAQFDQRQAHAQHILVATEEEAKAVKAELEEGADFATVAKDRSTDPSAQSNGGDLGTFGRGTMVPEFEQVVFSLKPGEISEPFATQFGWHVVYLVSMEGTAPDLAAMQDQVREVYLNAQVQARIPAYMGQLRANATIENTLK